MKYCTYCGAAIDDGVSFCPNCGARVDSTSSADSTAERVDSVFGADTAYTDTRDHTPSKGAAVISFLFPIIGLILYLVWNQSKPGKANSVLKGLVACLGFNIPIVGIILYFVWKDEKPDFARLSMTWGIVGFVFAIVVSIGSFVLGIAIAMLEINYESALAAMLLV